MVKLLYPDGKMTDEEAYELIDFAAESRKRVKDQLYIIDETFKAEPAKFKYVNLKTGQEVEVETLERLSNNIARQAFEQEEESEPEDKEGASQELREEVPTTPQLSGGVAREAPRTGRRPRIRQLAETTKMYREGQTGVSYKTLFADYLMDAKEITVEDPYLRTPWQLLNFIDFVSMIVETREVDDLKIHLKTTDNEENIPELIGKLDVLKNDLSSYGIDFTYKIEDFHDRIIKTDTGWNIILSRGLDIFEKFESQTIACCLQSKRKCKQFNVTYTKVG